MCHDDEQEEHETDEKKKKKECLCEHYWGRMENQQEKDGIGMKKKLPLEIAS